MTLIKQMLQSIYDMYFIGKTAKTTDIEQYHPCKASKQTVDGVRVNEYEIL